MSPLEIYIDGASKGNPGPSGIGAVICRDGQVIKNISAYIGTGTNNVAEYRALIWALEEGLMLKAQSVKVKTDSQLLCNQMNRVYKIKSENIAGLYRQAQHLTEGFKDFQIDYIPRSENRGADKLATLAIREELRGKSGGGKNFDNWAGKAVAPRRLRRLGEESPGSEG